MLLLVVQYVFPNRAVATQLVVARPDEIAGITLTDELGAQARGVMRDLEGMGMDRGKHLALVRLPGLTSFRNDFPGITVSVHDV
jgi:hypothetical protein